MTMFSFRMIRSRRYLQRILLWITPLLTVLLLLSAVFQYYFSEKIVLDVQLDANRKVLTQINNNISYMNDTVRDSANYLHSDTDINLLMLAKEKNDFFYRSVNRLSSYVTTSPFLHSIFVYNGYFKDFFVGSGTIGDTDAAWMKQELKAMLLERTSPPKGKFVPIKLGLSGNENEISFFSYFLYPPTKPGLPVSEAIVLNVNPAWLFENIKSVNRTDDSVHAHVFIMDDSGRSIDSDSERMKIDPQLTALIQQRAKTESADYFIENVHGAKQIVTYMDAGLSGWTIVTLQPFDQVLEKVVQLRNTFILITLIFLVVSIVLVGIISSKLYGPVDKMLRIFRERTADGEQPPSSGSDEMSFVSSSYQSVLDKLQVVRKDADENQNLIRNYYMRKLMLESPTIGREEWEASVAHNQLDIQVKGHYLLAVIRVDDYKAFVRNVTPSDVKLYYFAVSNIAKEIISRKLSAETIDMRSDHLVTIMSTDNEIREDDLMDILHLLRELQDTFKRFYKLSVSITISDVFEHYHLMTEQYGATLQNSQYRIVFGKKSVISPQMVASNNANDEYGVPAELEKALVENIKTGRLNQLDKTLDDLFDRISGCHSDHILYPILRIAAVVKQTVMEMNQYKIQPITADLLKLRQRTMERETLEEIREDFRAFITEITETHQTESKSGRNDVLVETIKEVIDATYSNMNLSLQSIADMLKMSSAYVGRIFRTTQGLSVADYINEVRLNQARKFLETGTHSTNEIMELSGYSNQSQFYKLFKKKYGTTPKEYRLKKALDQD